VGSDSDGYSHRVTLRDPALYAVRTLRQALESAGIPVEGAARRLRPGESYDRGDAVFLRRTSLVPVLRKMVRRSHNHYAEQVWKTVGAETSGVGSWEAGTARAAAMLRRMGFRAAEFSLADGSGLSRENRVSPALLTTLLTRMRLGEHGEVFASLLPAAGMHGTLDDRLDEPPYAGNVRAKTGYLNGVGALSGYATTRGGIEVVFSILVNDRVNPPGTYSMRRTVDPICRAIVDNAG
jgi:D-alanyl-D-alanine carboxypeptidase/D-alanyl-D-alanine-endopeptidase (penicillin-binding protein 4)